MSLKKLGGVLVVSLLLGGVVAAPAEAYDREALRARLDAARAEREAKSVARRAERDAQKEEYNNQDDTELPVSDHSCDVDFDLDKASLVWVQSGLTLQPRVDIKIDADDIPFSEGWATEVNYQGTVTYAEGTIPLPGDSSFSGSKSFHHW